MSTQPDRYAGITQALRILALISGRPHTREELAEDLGVHERTVRRLIEAIRAGGVDVVQRRSDGPISPLVYSVKRIVAKA